MVQLNLAGGGNLAWDPASCWLCSFVLVWQGEQHPSQVEAGMSLPPERDGDRWYSLEWL